MWVEIFEFLDVFPVFFDFLFGLFEREEEFGVVEVKEEFGVPERWVLLGGELLEEGMPEGVFTFSGSFEEEVDCEDEAVFVGVANKKLVVRFENFL